MPVSTLASIKNSNGEFFSRISDPLNIRRQRNSNNTPEYLYNCMAYAFNSYCWMVPLACQFFFDDVYESESEYDDEGNIISEPEDYYTKKEITEYTNELWNRIVACGGNERDFEDIFCDADFTGKIGYKLVINNLLNTFKGLRQINSLSDLKEDEYGIIYAAGYGDFHFCKYDPVNDIFSHKMGHLPIEIIGDYEEAFSYRYDGERVFFAMKGNAED